MKARTGRILRWVLPALMLMALALLVSSPSLSEGTAADNALRGYTKEDGYVYVNLGTYPQRIDGGVPEEDYNSWKWASNPIHDPSSVTVYTDPILWRVLTVDEEKAYLCSEYVLFCRPVHPSMAEYREIGADFGNTELSHYLNEVFAQEAFTAEELNMLLPFETFGKVFLLSVADAKNKSIGLGQASSDGAVLNNLKAWPTEYCARMQVTYVTKTKFGAHVVYWLRDQSKSDKRHATKSRDNGRVGHLHCDAEDVGVRPAVHLDLSAFEITGGSGTKTDPYTLAPRSNAAP